MMEIKLQHTAKQNQRLKNLLDTWRCWCTPLTPALGRQRQVNLSEFEASLVHRVNPRTSIAKHINSISKIHEKKKLQHTKIQYTVSRSFLGLSSSLGGPVTLHCREMPGAERTQCVGNLFLGTYGQEQSMRLTHRR